MFQASSRYLRIPTVTATASSGEAVVYKTRRILPQASAFVAAQIVLANANDRLDRLASESLGDPQLFWRLCDANNVMNPLSFLKEHSISVVIPRMEAGTPS